MHDSRGPQDQSAPRPVTVALRTRRRCETACPKVQYSPAFSDVLNLSTGKTNCRHSCGGLPMKAIRILGCMAVLTFSLMADLAFAQRTPPSPAPTPTPVIRGAPAPLIGVGLPMAGAGLLALLLVRRFRRKE